MCKLKLSAEQIAIANATPTSKQYTSLQEAYSYFNQHLFNDVLPPVFITFQRQKKSHGYYWHEKLENRESEQLISEIALNIGDFSTRDDRAILSTLVHEMAHHWQFSFGEPTRNGYHNKEWGTKMKEVGLYPSNTGQVGGKETGQQMTHYIVEGGLFDVYCTTLLEAGIVFEWNSLEHKDSKAKKAANKVKYTCTGCEANAWGKPELSISCVPCGLVMLSNN